MKNLMRIEQNKKAYHESVMTQKSCLASFNARFDNSDPFEQFGHEQNQSQSTCEPHSQTQHQRWSCRNSEQRGHQGRTWRDSEPQTMAPEEVNPFENMTNLQYDTQVHQAQIGLGSCTSLPVQDHQPMTENVPPSHRSQWQMFNNHQSKQRANEMPSYRQQ